MLDNQASKCLAHYRPSINICQKEELEVKLITCIFLLTERIEISWIIANLIYFERLFVTLIPKTPRE